MNRKSKLTREEYKEKFDKLFSELYYIPLPDEKIMQCNEGYPDYWFISNKGYVLSISSGKIKRLKPYATHTGAKNKDGERPSKKWYVGKRRQPGSGTIDRFYLHKMVAEHFLTCELEHDLDESLEVHHKQKVITFEDNECSRANNVDNLQILPKSIHQKATNISKKTADQLDLEIEEKIKASEVPNIQLPEQIFEQWLVAALQSCINMGNQPVMMLVDNVGAKDPSKIKVSVHPINTVELIED